MLDKEIDFLRFIISKVDKGFVGPLCLTLVGLILIPYWKFSKSPETPELLSVLSDIITLIVIFGILFVGVIILVYEALIKVGILGKKEEKTPTKTPVSPAVGGMTPENREKTDTIQSENEKEKLVNSIKIEIYDFIPGLKVPRLKFKVKISNGSGYDLQLTKFKYDIDFISHDNTWETYSRLIEHRYYHEKPHISRQNEISFEHSADLTSDLVHRIRNKIEDMRPDSKTQWEFNIQSEFEGPETKKITKVEKIRIYKSRSWIMTMLEQ